VPTDHFIGVESPLRSSEAAVNRKKREFDPNTFLATIGDGRKNLAVAKKQTIFAQGDEADAVFYIQTGKVKLTVVSKTGREATIGMLGGRNFFGEGALAGQALRMGSAVAMTDCELMRGGQGGDDGSASPGACVFGYVRGVFAGTEYPL